MRVLLVNKFWYPQGGAEAVVFRTKELLEKAGHTVAVFGMRHPKNIFQNDYFVDEVNYNNISGWGKLKFAWRFISNAQARNNFERLVKDFHPDVVHLHNIYHQLSFSLLDITRKLNIPVVMTLHDYKMISPNYNLYLRGKIDESACAHPFRCILNNCMENTGWSWLAVLENYYRRWKNYARQIDHYISPSNFLKDKFVQYGFAADKIAVVANPYNARAVAAETPDDGYILYFGRLAKEKGLDTLLAAAQKTPQIKYAIAGAGPEETRLKKFVENNNLANVDFLGYNTGARLEDIIARARIVVLPSVWYENYPLSVLEAQARSKIVIASDIGGIPELVDEDFLVPPGDGMALASAIENTYRLSAPERQAIGRTLRARVEANNNSEQYLNQLIMVYEEAQK